MIHVKVNKQSLTAVTDDPLVAKSVGIVTFEAEFSPEWDKYEKTIVFSGPGGTAPVLYLGGEMTVPWEALVQHGCLHVSAVGLADGMRGITAKGSPLWINRSGELGFEIPEGEPTPGPTEQAILACARYAREAKEAKDKTAEIAVEVEKNAGLAVGAAEESRSSAEAAGQSEAAAEEAAKEVAKNLSTVQSLAERVGKDAANSAANADSALDSQKKSEAAANRAEGAAGQAGGFATQADQSRAAAVEAEDNAKAALRDTEAARDGAMQSEQDAASSAGDAKDAMNKAIAAGDEAEKRAKSAGSAANAAGSARDTAVDAANLTVQAKNEAEQAAGASANSADEADNFRKQAENSSKEAVAASDEAKKAEQEAKDTVKDLLDKVAIRDTLTGPIIQGDFIGGTPIIDYRIDIEATQEGEGEPSQENVRAISGVDAIILTECGKNLVNVDTYTALSGGSSTGFIYGNQNMFDKIKKLPNGIYTVSYNVDANGGDKGSLFGRISIQDNTGQFLIKATNTFEMNDNVRRDMFKVALYGYFPNQENTILNFQIVACSVATNYEPYSGTTHAIVLPETCYGGYIDYKRKKYVQTQNKTVFTGVESEKWYDAWDESYKIDGTFLIYTNIDNIVLRDRNAITNMFTVSPKILSIPDTGFSMSQGSGKSLGIRIPISIASNLAEWRSYLANNPLELHYNLETPIEYDLPDLPQLTALDGKTTIYSDAKEVSVTGYMDTKHYIDKKLIELTALKLEG